MAEFEDRSKSGKIVTRGLSAGITDALPDIPE